MLAGNKMDKRRDGERTSANRHVPIVGDRDPSKVECCDRITGRGRHERTCLDCIVVPIADTGALTQLLEVVGRAPGFSQSAGLRIPRRTENLGCRDSSGESDLVDEAQHIVELIDRLPRSSLQAQKPAERASGGAARLPVGGHSRQGDRLIDDRAGLGWVAGNGEESRDR